MLFFSTEIDGSGWSLVFWIFDQNRVGFQEVREPLGGGVRGVSGGSQAGGGGPRLQSQGRSPKGFQKIPNGPRAVRGVPGGSQGGPRGVPGGSQGGPRGFQGGPREVPESVGPGERQTQKQRSEAAGAPLDRPRQGGSPESASPGPRPPRGTPLTPVKKP